MIKLKPLNKRIKNKMNAAETYAEFHDSLEPKEYLDFICHAVMFFKETKNRPKAVSLKKKKTGT